MAKSKRKQAPKIVLKLPDLEQSKSAVLKNLTSTRSKVKRRFEPLRSFLWWQKHPLLVLPCFTACPSVEPI